MPVLTEKDDPGLFQIVTERNLLRQYSFLQTTVELGLQKRDFFTLSHELICELNRAAVIYLSDSAGAYRKEPIQITHSNHTPPHFQRVQSLMDGMLKYVGDNWDTKDAIHLAAYTLWRLCWIHPFVQGNGRTARATSYLVLCFKLGFWLPGVNTIMKQIQTDRGPYYAALHAADDGEAKKILDVAQMEAYLNSLLIEQLKS
jgi:Fic family protein